MGFRRGSAISDRTGHKYQFAQHLRHDTILSYEEQEDVLVRHGFVLWDIVGSCDRKRSTSSLDKDIVNGIANDVPNLVEHECPRIRRIVMANGGQQCLLFLKHFLKSWMEPAVAQGRLVFQAANDAQSEKHFGKVCQRLEANHQRRLAGHSRKSKPRTITLVSAMSVSPSAACYSYVQKREYWETHVYKPGLEDLCQQAKEEGGA